MEKELIQDFTEIPIMIVNPKFSRRQIKDKAADMVVGLDNDAIEDFNKNSSKGNRILNRVYNRYNKKYNDEKFANLSLKEINKLSPKEQERWFALNKSKTAGPVLGGIAALTMPTILGPLVEAPMLTLASLGGSAIGSKIGQSFGQMLDRNNHGYTNYTDTFALLGGFAGGVSPVVINRGWNNISAAWNSGKQSKPNYSNWGGEFVDDVMTAHSRPNTDPNLADISRYRNWQQTPKYTGYIGMSLPNARNTQFKDDVALLSYYGINKTTGHPTNLSPTYVPELQVPSYSSRKPPITIPSQSIYVLESPDVFPINNQYVSGIGKLLGEGSESVVYDAGTGYVNKIIKQDLSTHIRPSTKFDNIYDAGTLFNNMQKMAQSRNRHFFVKNSYPAVVREPGKGYRGLLIQKKLTPITNNNYFDFEKQWQSLQKRPFWREIYSDIKEPVDVAPRNFAFDENGVIWGIDLWKDGGKLHT